MINDLEYVHQVGEQMIALINVWHWSNPYFWFCKSNLEPALSVCHWLMGMLGRVSFLTLRVGEQEFHSSDDFWGGYSTFICFRALTGREHGEGEDSYEDDVEVEHDGQIRRPSPVQLRKSGKADSRAETTNQY